jgi:hypothetical protein
MTTPIDLTATGGHTGSSPGVQGSATSAQRRKASVRVLVSTIMAALGVALLLNVAVCLLPENDYQRWRFADDNMGGRLRWIYERIHFDPKPIDVAILGPSRAQLGFSAAAIEQDLAQQGKKANVVNFALPGAGRDIQWAILNELYKTKSPKVIVVEVDDEPYPFGHFAFKNVAPANAIAFPPTPFLHNYPYNLAYLPIRKLTLFGANLFPNLFGLPKEFDPGAYARTRTDFTTSFIGEFGKLVDMEHPVPREVLLAQKRVPFPQTLFARALTRLNGGEDRLHIEKIAREAQAHGAKTVFVYMPMFEGSPTIGDLDFLKQFGLVINNGDFAPRDELFENWSHLNHAGAMKASARLADAIGGLDL